MADYDSGEVTDRERLAAKRQDYIARYNSKSIENQLKQQFKNYDFADKQNKALADVQLKQNSRAAEGDRFEAQRNLQNATIGLLGSMNQAMNGSSVGNLMRMLENRNDADNQTYWNQLMKNNDAVYNAYNEALNQNNVARRDAASNAYKGLRDIQGDLAANLSNINPNLYERPGSNERLKNRGIELRNKGTDVKPNLASLSGYLMPDTPTQTARDLVPRNRLRGNDYFSTLINGFNGR